MYRYVHSVMPFLRIISVILMVCVNEFMVDHRSYTHNISIYFIN